MRRIEDYALIGDCETAALVSRDGSIDWLCWPRFDSEACFAALLGTPEHGRWLIAPSCGVNRATRRYRDDALILETTFETDQGIVTLIDFMPVRDSGSDLVRIVRCEKGEVPMRVEFTLRFDYGRLMPWMERPDERCWQVVAGPHSAVLRTDVPVQAQHYGITADFTVREDRPEPFVLSYRASHLPLPEPVDAENALHRTEQWWRRWISHCSYKGAWAEPVQRSLITIKAMTYRPTGGIIAAPTTSLPERQGGQRNWDYRFCWLRDATFMVACLLKAGFRDEARAWRDWLLRAVAGMPAQVQPIYGIAGEHRLNEWEASWLPGFNGAKPVRVGNAAFTQFQLDVFGEVMNALHFARRAEIAPSEAGWHLQKALLDHLGEVWDEPDEGIWEVRAGRQHFVHSKVMAWVGVDRAIKATELCGLEGPVEQWKTLRNRIHAEVCERGFDPQRGAFVQAFGSQYLDASTLVIPIVGFLPVTDPRMQSTIAVIERDLIRDGFVLRYDTGKTKDGLPPGEGAFLVCSFWLAENYSLQGRHDEARDLFERLLTLRNDVGLLAEEYDPAAKTFLGNFPQALSHLALVNTAHKLSCEPDAARASLDP
ncbi:glycoside hydrolase family 15 protein [Microvirga sp. TS319]|uniref:glycoside hydrolase family 15 protein n=1 Tax=Microvirga sp. TS319 TaxID=3241165 RepID=UPI00351A61C5